LGQFPQRDWEVFLALLDWIVVAIFLCGVLGIGMWFSKRASGSLENFFLSGRNLPWWLAGTSILATSFASDTPLHVTRVIREEGLSGTWFYWSGILTHLVVTFWFARLWRRTGVLTDAEFTELRYSGRPAAVLRGTMGAIRGLFLEALTLAWVTLGMVKVVGIVLGLPETFEFVGITWSSNLMVVAVLMALVLVYSVSAGLWGVVVTDFIEFIVAMGGAVLVAVIGWNEIGGSEGLRDSLEKNDALSTSMLDFFPDFSQVDMSGLTMAVYLGVLWWANGAIDGSGKRAQRFLACRSEADALGSGIWNVAVQWIMRSWPWYVAALVSLVLYPELADPESAYPMLIKDLLPVGLKGLMVAAFLAAFMSTVDTHLNLSSAYVVNDLYKRFLVPDEQPAHYVRVARFSLVGLAIVTGLIALWLPSIFYAYKLKMELIGGLGGVILMRWLWWRVNAWCELTALGTSMFLAIGLHFSPINGRGMDDFAMRMLIIVGVSTLAWVIVAFCTEPEPREQLRAFYGRVGPPRWGWRPIAKDVPDAPDGFGTMAFVQALICAVFVFTGLFGIGFLILGPTGQGLILVGLSALSCGILLWLCFYRKEPTPRD
jgi:Na+/proline symporter